MRNLSRILTSVLVTVLLAIGGFFVLLISIFGGNSFYPIIVAAFFIALWVFVIMCIWRILKPKVRFLAFGAVVAVMAVALTGFEINKAYHDSFEKVDEREVDLTQYDPFNEDSLVAVLEEPSTFRLTDELPRLDGATALYPVYSAFVRAVYPEDFENSRFIGDVEVGEGGDIYAKPTNDIILTCSKTDGAYMRLIHGETDIIFAAGPSEEQLQMAKEAGVELKLTPLGREAFVFFVNAENPINGLSMDDIRRIYSGDITNWRALGGHNAAIRAFQRPENSGSQTALINFMGDTPLMTPPKEDVAEGMGGIISQVSAYRNYDNAIGYSFLFFATSMVNDNKIKLLELNGIAPTRENVANRSYPYSAEFYAITAGTDNPNADAFIEWMLSEQGQYLIEKTGYTPLT